MKILAIETSCDETAVALLECDGGIEDPRFKVLGEGLYSQVAKHAPYGGVFPTLAKREHQHNLIPLLQKTLTDAGMYKERKEIGNHSDISQIAENILEREPELLRQFLAFIPSIEKPPIDAIAATQGPGLEPALWVGLNFAKALSLIWNVPFIPVNHMEGHVFSVLLEGKSTREPESKSHKNIEYPALALLISGGHTELVLAEAPLQYRLLGQTRDDAVGEAFDKVARMLGLPYPGGPEISRLAEKSRTKNPQQTHYRLTKSIILPRPMINSGDYDFSFSGLKTAVLYKIRELGELSERTKEELAREFEDAVIDVLSTKTMRALDETGARTFIIGGGVVANKALRRTFEEQIARRGGVVMLTPAIPLATDNAAMIGMAAYLRWSAEPDAYTIASPDASAMRADGNLALATRQRIVTPPESKR